MRSNNLMASRPGSGKRGGQAPARLFSIPPRRIRLHGSVRAGVESQQGSPVTPTVQHAHTDFYLTSFDSKAKIKNARILDYGCGDGYAGTAMLSMGAKWVDFYDPFANKDQFIGDKSKIIRNLGKDHLHYDIVWCHHVIEHVDNPSATLADMRQRLSPGGQLWLACPSMLDHSIYSPGHVNNFVVPNLLECAQRSGWNIFDAKWWWIANQLRVRLKNTKEDGWPAPCFAMLSEGGRIDPEKLPNPWLWTHS